MWPFAHSESLAESGACNGMIDYHSHLLPGVDDGVESIKESLEILVRYMKLGIREVWLTPHISEDFPNTTHGLRKRFNELKEACPDSIQLHLSAENMIDNLFVERLEKNDVLPVGNENCCLLVETSCFSPGILFYEVLNRIQSKGYHPLLAHPERYEYMQASDYRELKKSNVRFQLDLPSLAGMYGKRVQKKAQWMMKNLMYDCVGTDVHSLCFFQTLFKASVKNEYHPTIKRMYTCL